MTNIVFHCINLLLHNSFNDAHQFQFCNVNSLFSVWNKYRKIGVLLDTLQSNFSFKLNFRTNRQLWFASYIIRHFLSKSYESMKETLQKNLKLWRKLKKAYKAYTQIIGTIMHKVLHIVPLYGWYGYAGSVYIDHYKYFCIKFYMELI